MGKSKQSIKVVIISIVSTLIGIIFMAEAVASESHPIRISCTIPATAGSNVPIIKESKATDQEQQPISEIIFQKNSTETRQVQGKQASLDVETFYSR